MKVKIISCWFNTSYAVYTNGLRKALERELGSEVGVIASNCGCHDPMDGVFFNRNCEYFDFPHMGYWRSENPVKRWIRLSSRQVLYHERAKKYLQRTGDANVLHFQQTLNAYGSLTLFNWLKMPSDAARVVTVHELDDYQRDYPKTNLIYNSADGILVHAGDLKEELIALGVQRELIDVVEHGVDLGTTPAVAEDRQGIIFYGGHKINAGKGLETLCQAIARIRERLGTAATPCLKIFGYYGEDTQSYGQRCADEAGVADQVRWLNRLEPDEIAREFRRSELCVLPFIGSFAGMAAGVAMANGVPVIGTRRAGLPEHLGDAGVWIEPKDVEGLTNAIADMLHDRKLRDGIVAKGMARARDVLNWDAVAHKTIETYGKALERRKIPPARKAVS
jgi:glycosyltransferase involved in cell wall biosynthesis